MGFTLIEIMIVVIVIITLSGLALPKYFVVSERMRLQEGENLLLTMYAAQKRYKLEQGSYATNLSDLDIGLRPSENFDAFAVSANPLAQIDRKENRYTLRIDGSGVISCSNDTADWCARLGY